jgi:hypothetical protein
MNRKAFFIILTVLCFIGAGILIVIGVRRTSKPAVIEGLESLGELTLEAYDAAPDEEGEEGQYTIHYRYIHPKYGEIVYSPSVDRHDYDSYMFDREAAKLDPENAPKTTVRRYVYVYPTEKGYESHFEDYYMSLYEVSELIEPSDPVSSTVYYIVAGIALLSGAYMLFLAFAGPRSKSAKA